MSAISEDELLTSLEWSDNSYTLSEFIEEHPLPQIVKVERGFDGGEDSATLGYGEVLTFHALRETAMISARDKNGNSLVIPSDSPDVVQVLPQESECNLNICEVGHLLTIFPRVKYVEVIGAHYGERDDEDGTCSGDILEIIGVEKRQKKVQARLCETNGHITLSSQCTSVFRPLLDYRTFAVKDLKNHFQFPVRVRFTPTGQEALPDYLSNVSELHVTGEFREVLVITTTVTSCVDLKSCYEIPAELDVRVKATQGLLCADRHYEEVVNNLARGFDVARFLNARSLVNCKRRDAIKEYHYESHREFFLDVWHRGVSTTPTDEAPPVLPPRRKEPPPMDSLPSPLTKPSETGKLQKGISLDENDLTTPALRPKPRSYSEISPRENENFSLQRGNLVEATYKASSIIPPKPQKDTPIPASRSVPATRDQTTATPKSPPDNNAPPIVSPRSKKDPPCPLHLPVSQDQTTHKEEPHPSSPTQSPPVAQPSPNEVPTYPKPPPTPPAIRNKPTSNSPRIPRNARKVLPVLPQFPPVTPKIPVPQKVPPSSPLIKDQSTSHSPNEFQEAQKIIPVLPQFPPVTSKIPAPNYNNDSSNPPPTGTKSALNTLTKPQDPRTVLPVTPQSPPAIPKIPVRPVKPQPSAQYSDGDNYNELKPATGEKNTKTTTTNNNNSSNNNDNDNYNTKKRKQHNPGETGSEAMVSRIPRDISGLTVQDVSDLLGYLRVEEHAKEFEMVDGELLKYMNREDFLSVNLIPFHATKLIKFVNGWRPKFTSQEPEGTDWETEDLYAVVARIPRDISHLSVGEVSDLLRNLKLGEYAKIFKEEMIDGSLLQDLDDLALESLNMRQFHAKKLIKFIQGWRPTH